MSNLDKDPKPTNIPEPSQSEEQTKRVEDVQQLVNGAVGRYAEFFSEPSNRLDFLKDQDADGYFRILQYVNAKVRGEKPAGLRQRPEEELGGSLPMMHTPSSADKLPAFKRGFEAIQEYLMSTTDPQEEQIEAVAMATEALIIWVHPFPDGNGRTSRFMGKLIEDGADDLDSLVEATVSKKARPVIYQKKVASREGMLGLADNPDIILDDNERKEMRNKAVNLPGDIEAIHLSVKQLLENKEDRQAIIDAANQFLNR